MVCCYLSFRGIKVTKSQLLRIEKKKLNWHPFYFLMTAYPNDAQRSAVAQALIEKHPCLKEPGSFNGMYGWQIQMWKLSYQT